MEHLGHFALLIPLLLIWIWRYRARWSLRRFLALFPIFLLLLHVGMLGCVWHAHKYTNHRITINDAHEALTLHACCLSSPAVLPSITTTSLQITTRYTESPLPLSVPLQIVAIDGPRAPPLV